MKELAGSIIVSFILIGVLIIGGEIYAKVNGGKVLSMSVAASLSPSPTVTATPTDTPTPTPTPTSDPTSTPSPKPKPTIVLPPPTSSQEVNGFIERFAVQYGVSPHVLRHLAICESGFKSNAKNGPYIGLYQFGPITWKNNRVKMGEDPNLGLRYNAEEAVQTAAYLISIGRIKAWPNCQP
jgi:soluble lytic murein transglycosylase-like protein